MKLKTLLATAAAAVCLPATSATIYSNNFETNMNGFTGAGSLTGSQGLRNFGFGNQTLRNSAGGNPATASVLNLNFGTQTNNLMMTLDFAALDSWDAGNKPDFFNIRVDRTSIFSSNFHMSGAHTIEFFASGNGWEAGSNESWAIDNILITGERNGVPQNVPEPLTGALMLAGLGALGFTRRRQ